MASSNVQVSDSIFIVYFMFFVIIIMYSLILTELKAKNSLNVLKYAVLCLAATFFTYVLMKEQMLDFFGLNGSGVGFILLVLITFERLDFLGYIKKISRP